MKDAKGHGSDAHNSGINAIDPAVIARWSSPKGKWTAELRKESGVWGEGYHLSSMKNGNPVGGSNMPTTDDPQGRWKGLHSDAEAIAHYDNHVRNTFDVGMKKVL
jgi:hypothetical protein